MMEIFLFYLLRASIATAILVLCYKFFLARNTFHILNRAVQLSILIASLIMPLFTIELPEIQFFQKPNNEVFDFTQLESNELVDLQANALPTKTIPWINIVFSIYLIGIGLFLLRYLTGMLRMVLIIRNSKKVYLDGNKLYISEQDITPFSWMNYIIISKKDFTAENADIIRHELAHKKLGHSIDLLFTDIYCITFWFNPFVWMLRNELKNTHEFQADAETLAGKNDYSEYQLLLVRHCVGDYKFSIANNFQNNNLQKRIQMIMKTKTPNKAKWRYFSLILGSTIIVMALFGFSATSARK